MNEKLILDFNEKSAPPKDWVVEGYAFGTHQPNPNERQRAAVASRNQRYAQKGKMTSPEFKIEFDYLKVTCAGTFHPTLVSVVLVVDGKDVRSCSPERGYGFLGYQLEQEESALFLPPDASDYAFCTRSLRGKTAKIELRDEHADGCLFSVKIVATDQRLVKESRCITSAARWAEDHFETIIAGEYLLLPVGPLVGTPVQPVTVAVDGDTLLTVDLPLAFGDIQIAGFLPIYDLTHQQGKSLKVSFHSYEGKRPGENSVSFVIGKVPLRDTKDNRPAVHIHNRLGLLNDPNGLVYHDQEWHIFHQFNYNVSHCSWAHYASKDLMHWEERPIALFHDELGSMHSGSATVDWFNTSGWQQGDKPLLVLAYTSSLGHGGKDCDNDQIQTQCLAYSVDGGRTFTKYAQNPVIGYEQRFFRSRPGDQHARDPKVFWFSPTKGMDPKAEDGYWVMVLFEGTGHSIYTSDDLKNWVRVGSIQGFFECPELFPLAIDDDPENIRWIMYGGSGRYHIGTFDGKQFFPETDQLIPLFHGGSAYAAQTFSNTPLGSSGCPRRIQVAWQDGRQGHLSLPSELELRKTPLGLRACMLPVKEIENLYERRVSLDGLSLSPDDPNPLSELTGGLYDIELEADLTESDQLALTIRGQTLVIESSADGLQLGQMKCPGQRLFLRLVVDNTSLDVYFGQHGLYYSPDTLQPLSTKLNLSVAGGSVSFATLQCRQLMSIWKALA